jgi:hypothetical protein
MRCVKPLYYARFEGQEMHDALEEVCRPLNRGFLRHFVPQKPAGATGSQGTAPRRRFALAPRPPLITEGHEGGNLLAA